MSNHQNIELENFTKIQFENILPFHKRAKVIKKQEETVNKFGERLNKNFFSNPSQYNPYLDFLGQTHEHLSLGADLSRPAMSVLYYLAKYSSRSHRLLDYGCGLSGLLKYGDDYSDVKGYDDYSQLPKEAIHYFCDQINLDPESKLINYKDIYCWKPTILSVCGIWLHDIEIYNLDSIKVLLSDTLYNSGSIENEGVFHYNPGWKNFPEKYGFRLTNKLPTLDVYVRD